MAAPSAPVLVLLPGPVPHSVAVTAAAVATATKYTIHLHGKTGVGKAGTNAVEKSAGVPDFFVYDLPAWPEVFGVLTATNVGAEESVDSNEDNIADWE